jgi:phage terminase large subunit-like protein
LQPKPAAALPEVRKSSSYADVALRYAQQVITGEILACKWVKLACQRQLDDLARQGTKEFPYIFDEARANRVCRFMEGLPHVKGKWAGEKKNIVLEPWQVFNTCCLFGWVHQAKATKYRFVEAYICVPRKNGKSIWAAGVGHFKFCADGEFGAEVYSGATSEKQAWEVFRPARWMAERTEDFREAFGIQVNAKSLTIPENGSRFEPIIGKPGDGASPSCAIADEYHEHESDELVSTMRTGMLARENPLLLEITTAGSDRSSPCYAAHLDAQKVLLGKLKNERLFTIIYTIDDGDDWTSKEVLRKANPNFDVSVSGEDLRAEQLAAIHQARKQNAFKTKHLNVWVNAAVAWMNMAKWDALADPKLKIEDFEGQSCDIGVDLAQIIDLACKAYLFEKTIECKKHYYGFAAHYLNETAVQESSNEHYAGWQNEGRLIVTSGSATDYTKIANDLIEDAKRFQVRRVHFDERHAAGLIQFIENNPEWNRRVELAIVQPNVSKISPPMKELEAAVLDGRFHHNGDPLLGWMISNIVCAPNRHDDLFPYKQRPESKIDAGYALILSSRLMLENPGGSVYDTRGIRTF